MRKLYIKIINLLCTVVKGDNLSRTVKTASLFSRIYVQKNVLKEGDSLSQRLHFAKKIDNPG